MQLNRNVVAVLAVVVFIATTVGVVVIALFSRNVETALALSGVLITSSGTLVTALIAAARAGETRAAVRENHDETTEKLNTISRRVNGELDERIESAVIRATQPLLKMVSEKHEAHRAEDKPAPARRRASRS